MSETTTKAANVLHCPEGCAGLHSLSEYKTGAYVGHEVRFGKFVTGNTFTAVGDSPEQPAEVHVYDADEDYEGLSVEQLRMLAASVLDAADWLEAQR